MIRWLDPRDPQEPDAALLDAARRHPLRLITRGVAAEVGVWTPATRRDVRTAYDEVADRGATRPPREQLEVVRDALERGGLGAPDGPVVELGCGDGWATPLLRERFGSTVAVDLSLRMLRRVGPPTPLVQADAGALPLPDHVVDVAVGINMLLFPIELDRVLAWDGAVVWVGSRGPVTPVHLAPEEVAAALPGRWGGVAARCGPGVWCVLRRDR